MNSTQKRKFLIKAVRENFLIFLHRVFLEIDNSQAFTQNWHLEVIADKLLSVQRGDIRRLVIAQPPRSLKSVCASVAFPAWILGHNPKARIICISYSQDLADKFGRQTRQVMESAWYKAAFPVARINPTKRADSEFETTARGFRLATSIGGRLTGMGGQYLIIDDPIKPGDVLSRVQRQTVNDWFHNTLYTRLDNKNTGAILLVMQRVHEEDLVAHVQKWDRWEVLSLPAIAPQNENYNLQNGKVLMREQGEALNPKLESLERLKEIQNTLGNYNFQAQYQQNPIPEKGNVINFDWFKRYTELPKNESGRPRIIQSWDTAMTEHDGSDYSVCITAQVINKQYYIRDVFRKRLLFPDLVREVKRLKSKYNAREVFIEDKASGIELIQLLRRQGFTGIQAIKPEGSKEDRIAAQSSLVESGRVFIPDSAPWIEEFKREVNAFPRGAHDDQLDALAQLLRREEEVGDRLSWLRAYARNESFLGNLFVGRKIY